ncbi:Transposase DDE domain-containing protein [Micromonospora inyonensis]|uniref:Transposase DDE domain-containing protein n=1 Tax=Micromonospora inyonensis TaxID=47866 RepID=A0A1C6RKX1_9ACTN|nr:transposase [Micromonospora inyonensis]SCL17822.1 Transposase DDE domain-containing protein [Micromonospora inyonensis]
MTQKAQPASVEFPCFSGRVCRTIWPPKSVAYCYFALWRDDRTDQTIHDLLRCQAKESAEPTADPSAVVLGAQSIRAANHVLGATSGKDAGKKVPGRKQGLAIDTLGLIIAVVVTATSVTDNTIGTQLLGCGVDASTARRGGKAAP